MTRRAVSARRACDLMGISRRWLGYQGRDAGADDDDLLVRLKELAVKHPRYGYRRLHVMLKREGRWKVNVKRVRRLCVLHGLKLRRKRPRKRRGIGRATPVRAEYANHVWAYDFVHDVCRDGRKLKILTVEEEWTRECLTIEVERRMPANFVCRTLLKLFEERGRVRSTCGATTGRSSSRGR
jgi:putative transposase